MNPVRLRIDRGPWLPAVIVSSHSDSFDASDPLPAFNPNLEPPTSKPDPLPTSNLESLISKSDELTPTESHPCIESRGEGVQPLQKISDSAACNASGSTLTPRVEPLVSEPPLQAVTVNPPDQEVHDVSTFQPANVQTGSVTCRHIDAKGNRCRMLPAKNHPSLCAHHARQEHRRRQPDDETQADELLASIPDFTTAASINLFLGNLVRQFARKRIARRDAIAMAYLGQLLLTASPL
jgi:hypothetical protein